MPAASIAHGQVNNDAWACARMLLHLVLKVAVLFVLPPASIPSQDPASPLMRETEFFTSHECLLLDYEEALTRQDSTTGLWCADRGLLVQGEPGRHVQLVGVCQQLQWPLVVALGQVPVQGGTTALLLPYVDVCAALSCPTGACRAY